jgi:hypothetical protein
VCVCVCVWPLFAFSQRLTSPSLPLTPLSHPHAHTRTHLKQVDFQSTTHKDGSNLEMPNSTYRTDFVRPGHELEAVGGDVDDDAQHAARTARTAAARRTVTRGPPKSTSQLAYRAFSREEMAGAVQPPTTAGSILSESSYGAGLASSTRAEQASVRRHLLQSVYERDFTGGGGAAGSGDVLSVEAAADAAAALAEAEQAKNKSRPNTTYGQTFRPFDETDARALRGVTLVEPTAYSGLPGIPKMDVKIQNDSKAEDGKRAAAAAAVRRQMFGTMYKTDFRGE